MIGSMVGGRYRVDAVVGTGAFATVYRAVDERFDTVVALKVLAENHSLDVDVRDRFISEARRLRRVASPFVVGVHDLGETDRQQPFIVMDLADRGDLAGRVAAARAEGREPGPADLADVASALAGALGVMHAERVVHRDLTPRNLLIRSVSGAGRAGTERRLLDADEEIVVGDLGLSKDLELASGITAAAGTPGFFPPEQRAGSGIDERTDVYAASALLVWLVTGRAPGEDGTWAGAAMVGWPPALTVALERGLSLDPRSRQSSAAAWRADIEAALAPSELASTESARSGAGSVAATDPLGEVPATRVAERSPHGSGGSSHTVGDDGSGRGRARTAAVAAAVAVLVAGALVLGRVTAPDASAPVADVEDVGDGRVRAEASEAGLTVAIEGPATLVVDELATFVVEPGDADSWAWVGPDGRITPDAEVLDVTAASAGRLNVSVVATDETGRTVRVELPVRAEAG